MIKIEYTLEREIGSKTEIYHPVLFENNQLNDLSEISAENDSGKSTFLQIIAMSFGASNENISNNELLGKINRLIKSYQKLTYKLIIDNPKFDYICKIEKPKKDRKDILFSRIYRNNNKTDKLSEITIRKNFKLIYDIPNDPLSRLRNLVDDLGDFQKEINPKLQIFLQQLNTNIDEIRNQPTKSQVDKTKEDINNIKIEIEDIKSNLDNDQKHLKSLRTLGLIRSYQIKKSEYNKTNKKLTEAREKDKKQGPKPKEINIGERSTILLNLNNKIKTIENNTEQIYNLLQYNFAEETNFDRLKKKYENIDFDDLRNKGPESSTISYFLNNTDNFLNSLMNRIGSEKDQKNLAFYRDIIEVFKRFKKNNPRIPGVKFSANEMIIKINKEIDKLGGLSEYQEEAKNKAVDFIKTVRHNRDEYFKYYLQNKEKLKSKKQTKIYIDYTEKIGDLKKERDQNKRDIGVTLKNLVEVGVSEKGIDAKLHKITNEFKKLSGLTNQNEISNRVNLFTNKVKDDVSTLARRKAAKRDLKIELGIKENQLKKKNPFSRYLELLQSYLEPATKLSHCLNDMNQLIQKMKTNDSLPNDSFSKKYIDMVNEFLAEKMQFVMHEGKKHSLKTVNYQGDYFITTDDIKLRFDDFGTGNSQVNYLKGLVERNYNNPMVVLLDETGNMSTKTIKILHNVLKNLYKDGKILVGILVKPGSESVVKSID